MSGGVGSCGEVFEANIGVEVWEMPEAEGMCCFVFIMIRSNR